MQNLAANQVVIKAAAVSDFASASTSPRKIKKEDGNELTLTFRKNPDILSDIASASPRPFVVAFAAETEALEENARQKLTRKDVDLIVANDVADNSIGFDSDQNEVLVIARDGSAIRIDRAPKLIIANRILDLVVARLPR